MKKIQFTLAALTMCIALVPAFAGQGLNTPFSMNATNLVKKNSLSLMQPELFSASVKSVNLRADEKRSFGEGKFVMSLGYGWPNLGTSLLKAIVDATDNTSNVSIVGLGPLHFRGEFGLSENVGLAASINYISAAVKWRSFNDTSLVFYDNKFERSSISVLARLNFHFGVSDVIDPYFGIGAGYKGVTWKIVSDDPSLDNYSVGGLSPFGFETTIGFRYYLTEGFGLYCEFGIAKSLVQGGIAIAL